MRYAVLGRLEIARDDEAVQLGSFRQRSLLALLLVNVNQVVSTDRIIGELWGDDAHITRQNTLWVHVSNLRSALQPDREKRSEGSVILTRAPGYVLQAEDDDIDTRQFEQLVAEGRGLVDRDPAAASVLIGEALALWRGRPYEDFTYESFAQAEISRLEELRLEAVELRIDADLRRGLTHELVAELEALARQHLLRERLTAQLMLALHRCGRRADALRAYRRLRAHLADELGIEPSAELIRLEAQILTSDAALELGSSVAGPGSRLGVRGYELREPLGESDTGVTYRAYQPVVGREVAIKVVRAELANEAGFIRRFEADAELVARLEHPNVVPVYDFWREPDAAYLVTRLFRNGTLTDAARTASLSPAGLAQVVSDVASALDHAHRHSVVHGHVTTDGIFVDEHGRGYLGEFGVGVGVVAEPTDDVEALAGVLRQALGDRAGPLSGPDARVQTAIGDVVARATSPEPGRRFTDAAAFGRALHQALGEPQMASRSVLVENPYKGLRAFGEPDADVFFGRERLVERLLARFGDRGTRGRFLIVVGPSGSGKSSVVSAGLLPALRAGALTGSETWFLTQMVPGGQPHEELEAALRRVTADPAVDLLEVLESGDGGIRRAGRLVLPEGSSQLVLVIDQFEELFTQSPRDVATAFLDALAVAVEDPHSRLRVVVTVRADFYDRPLAHRAVGELMRRGTEVITPMFPDELERAIVAPAALVGVRFEPGLVAEMIADVRDRPGALPLMQYALTELFDGRRGDVIERTTYRSAGGVAGALARRADALYDDLDAAGQAAARQIFLRLVSAEDEADGVRRRVAQQQLLQAGGPAADAVLQAFGRHRLLTFDRDPTTREPTVDIAHETLLVTWDRLRTWVDDARDDLRQRRRLSRLAGEWERTGRDPGYLVHGPQLEQLAAWADMTDLALDPAERDLLDASSARRESERSHEQGRRDREELLRRTARRRTRLLAGSAAGVVVLGALTVFAVSQQRRSDRLATEQAATVEASRFAAESVDASGHDPELAMLLALQSLATSAEAGTPALSEAEEALHWALQAARITYPTTNSPIEVRSNPNGPAGIYRMPLPELVEFARGKLSRMVSADECGHYRISPCPGPGSLASPQSTGPAMVPDGPLAAVVPASAQPLAGTNVRVLGIEPPDGGLRAELDHFTERTGITVEYELNANLEGHLATLVASGHPPDVAMLPQPGSVLDLAERGELVDLGSYLDVAAARSAFSDYLVSSVSAGAALYAVPTRLDMKAIVWYPVPEFAAAGYTPPSTWDELLALSERIVADDRQPWCMGFEAAEFTGWPATDLVEAFVLRIGGVELYDRWVRHEVSFADGQIRRATSMMGDLVFGDGFVRGDVGVVNRRSVLDAGYPLFEDPPGCWLYHQGSFAPSHLFPARMRLGVDVDFFPLPPIEPGGETTLFGGGTLAAAFNDRPEVRELLRTIASPEWGIEWAASPVSDFLPSHAEFDIERCRTTAPGADPRTGDVRVELCGTLREAIRDGTWRFDASDLMPPAVGAITASGQRGAFLQGMLDYIDEGPDSLDRILADIDAVWQTE